MKRILAFVFVLMLLLSGCSSNNDSNSNNGSEASQLLQMEVEYLDNGVILETAKQLLLNDKLITDLFVGGKLTELVDVNGKNPADFTPATGTEYEDFYVIEKLLTSTYSVSGGTVSKYLGFPKYGFKSILPNEGKTYFSFHYTEKFQGIDINSISVFDGNKDDVKTINAGEYTLSMVFDGSAWLLEDSIYFLYKQKEDIKECEIAFPLMNQGSAKALLGKILVVGIFINEKENSFTDQKMSEFEAKINDSIEFLTLSAEKYGSFFEIDYEQRLLIHKSKINFSLDDPYAFDTVLSKTIYSNLDKYINDKTDTTIYDNYFVVICTDKKGSGYALPYKGKTDVFYAERCVLFSNDDAGDLAKNILALFGAQTQTDKYLSELYKKYSKNDIILVTDIKNAQLSEMTAYQVGITKFLDKQFYAFYLDNNENQNINSQN